MQLKLVLNQKKNINSFLNECFEHFEVLRTISDTGEKKRESKYCTNSFYRGDLKFLHKTKCSYLIYNHHKFHQYHYFNFTFLKLTVNVTLLSLNIKAQQRNVYLTSKRRQ